MAIGERLAARDPTNVRAQLDLSTGWMKKGAVELAAGGPQVARAAYLRALAIAESVSARDPGNAEALRHVSVAASKVGSAWIAEGKPEEAVAFYERAADVARRQATADPRNLVARRDLGVARYYAMVTHADLGRIGPWREAAAESLEAFRAVHAASAEDPVAANDLALALGTAAGEALAFPDVEAADVALALSRARERVAIPGRESPDAYVILSDVARRADAPGEAEDALRKALALVDAWPDAEAKAAKRAEIAARLESLRASRPR
jgi:tetratricopeptide (TPR) repeat protein